jgi:Transposase DDE domain
MAGVSKPRKHLSADALVTLVRARFEQMRDPRPGNVAIPLADALMSGFAMFALKDPSLLAFDQRRHDDNLRSLYHIGCVPSDTQMRAILDQVPPDDVRPAFQDVFRQLQRGKVLEPYVYLEGCYLLALDGTGHFSSSKIHCPCCLQKEHADGSVEYYHQMLGAVLLHPDKSEVIPLAPEPIIKQDGQTKNDCERNACRRFLEKFRRVHPHLPVIVVEDALSSNAPHIRDLQKYGLHYILGVKEGDHAHLFAEVRRREELDQGVTCVIISTPEKDHVFTIVRDVPLNESNPDVLVTFVRYIEDNADGRERVFTWVTDLAVTKANVWKVMKAGRARWKIENETFNTLKNQGYGYEHNYGHGAQHLCVVLALLMMLAFLVDQVQQLCDPLFQGAWHKLGSKRLLWERLRSMFCEYRLRSLQELYHALYYGCDRPRPRLNPCNTS